jgi:hypothetical protein
MEILDARSPARPAGDAAVAALFRARYAEMVRLAGLLGADDPEDVAQEAFARLLNRHGSLRDVDAAVGYVRATVCNLTRNRRRHLRVASLRAPAAPPDTASSEQVAIFREEHREVLARRGSPSGRRIPRAGPAAGQVWLVSYPTTEAATLLFGDVAGQVVSTLHAAANGLPVT